MSHNTIAARVRKEKEQHPERYCRAKSCLFRTPNEFCDRHQACIDSWISPTERIAYAERLRGVGKIEMVDAPWDEK
jgi:hypothetical protein